MTEPTAGDPFATPPGGRPAAPASPQAYPVPPQAYPAPDGYYPYGYPPQKKPKSWMNIVSLCAVAGGFIIPFFANIAGIVFGHLGRRAAKRGEADYAGVGLAGLILNYIAVVLWILGIIAYIVFIVWAINDCSNNPNSSFCSGSTTFGT
jgi:hypothetical protein